MTSCSDIGPHLAEILLAAIGAVSAIVTAYFAYKAKQGAERGITIAAANHAAIEHVRQVVANGT
jgi:hypothetical protein